ncbi:MAG: type II toxin-antitoxin system death-on-curing family toxin [Thermoanaerobaculia bacterium]
MRYLTIAEVLYLHRMVIAQSGGSSGIRDLGGLESAIAQPQATFAGSDLYPDVGEKATALCFSLVLNHPFVDGNKRVGHAAMETFLVLNGFDLSAPVSEQEELILALANGSLSREELLRWVDAHIRPRARPS